jgi:hypothetical protein
VYLESHESKKGRKYVKNNSLKLSKFDENYEPGDKISSKSQIQTLPRRQSNC